MGRQKGVEVGGRKVTQAAAMRTALGELGMDAKNKDLEKFIKDHYGLIIGNISVLKSNQKKTMQEKGMTANGNTVGRAKRGSTAGSGSNTLDLLQELADRLGGMDELVKLVQKLS